MTRGWRRCAVPARRARSGPSGSRLSEQLQRHASSGRIPPARGRRWTSAGVRISFRPLICSTGQFTWRAHARTQGRRAFGIAASAICAAALSAAAGAQTDPIVGTWKLDVAKSTYKPGPPPKSATVVPPAPSGGFRRVRGESLASSLPSPSGAAASNVTSGPKGPLIQLAIAPLAYREESGIVASR